MKREKTKKRNPKKTKQHNLTTGIIGVFLCRFGLNFLTHVDFKAAFLLRYIRYIGNILVYVILSF